MHTIRLLSLLALCLLVAPVHAQTNPTAELLRELIRIDTSNPPGNEGALAEFLRPRFEELGFEVSIVETPTEGKAHFIARLRGDGSMRPILLAAHAEFV